MKHPVRQGLEYRAEFPRHVLGDRGHHQIEAVGSIKGDQVGAKRILNGAFHETLLSLGNIKRRFTYQFNDGLNPVDKDLAGTRLQLIRWLSPS